MDQQQIILAHDRLHNQGQPGTTKDNQGQPRATWDNLGQPTNF